MYKDLKIKISKFIIKTKQNYRNKELQLLRQNHQRSTNELHIKLETYKPLATLYEIDDIEEIGAKGLKTKKSRMDSRGDLTDSQRKRLDKYKNSSKIHKICTNIFGTTTVCDLIATDLTF
uniref:Uncharacterized protein n=1 Tax=Strongyloides papillosus TaxID=174720 RepID=A0A0N5BDY8_STREA